jgi:hypothetical protein
VTAEEQARIRALVGTLATPRPECPGADRLAAFRAALTRLAQFPDALLEREFFGVLDVYKVNHLLRRGLLHQASCGQFPSLWTVSDRSTMATADWRMEQMENLVYEVGVARSVLVFVEGAVSMSAVVKGNGRSGLSIMLPVI